ncbi:hypothetical protein O6H91_11G068700 [Diphasiastrum complanatum]|uniref:Uncharacterized protein n=1 Tax=Diphasiastrum complanatum TaxID=34168 RepID=A0ACC2CAD2_DIPCM|nr:hypothetical protein O6H91_11G068700 [Diphasiastrum complanatum]
MMEMAEARSPKAQSPPCAQEALQLLNCVASENYDPRKCVSLLAVLRRCVEIEKVRKFSIAGSEEEVSAAGTSES